MSDLYERNNLKSVRVDYKYHYDYYREKFKHKSRRFKASTKQAHNNILRECLKEIARLWTNSTGGVYIKGMGYFTFLRSLYKFVREHDEKFLENLLMTGGYSYLFAHQINLKGEDNFCGFKVKRPFYNIRMSAYENIVGGRRYTINSLILKEYLKRAR